MTPIISKYGLFIVLGFILVEGLVSYFRSDATYEKKDTIANMVNGVIGNILGRTLWASLGYAVYGWVHSHALFKMPMDQWWAWAALILLADFAWYWEHRAGHEARLLWAVHSIHHSSEKFNYSVALRLPWLGGLTRIPFLMPLAFLGFEPVYVFTGFSIVFLYQIWIHTEYVGKIGFLEEIINTPSHHRVHHATNEKYLDKNYGGILILWDKLFGTFKREEETPSYGILHPIASYNPWVINTRDLFASIKATVRARSVPEAAKIAFGDPAWVPAGDAKRAAGGE